MDFTRTTSLRAIRITITTLVIILIVAYALWRSLAYARGPSITLSAPLNYSSINSSTTHVIGRVERANTITLNGKAVTIDEQGHFDETIIVFPGTNILTLEARDQFNRTVKEQVTVVKP
jgi:hypothetical protein